MNKTPRNEYPRPTLVRKEWLNLNGEWEFEFDESKNRFEDKLGKRYHPTDKERQEALKKVITSFPLKGKIIVPFCPESKLSGIGNIDFHNAVIYRKTIDLPLSAKGKQTILHFGASDYATTVYINGDEVGTHLGGMSSFSFDITDKLTDDKNVITVYVVDDTRSYKQPLGKQSTNYWSEWCSYRRTTGIWQTVWLEFVPKARLLSYYTVADLQNKTITFNSNFTKDAIGKTLTIKALYEGKEVGKATAIISGESSTLTLPLSELHLWEVGNGRLYDAEIIISKGKTIIDSVKGYFGMRTVGIDGYKFMLNGKSVFGRWVLNQGFYPDGIMTAKDDDELKNDIIYSQSLGFNGARLHQKVFEERFLYYCDKLGYIVWGEFPSWGIDIGDYSNMANYLPEWLEVLNRDRNHPSIIGWMPFNETWGQAHNKIVEHLYYVTKAVDPTRPCIDTSGNYHTVTDIFDVHDYEQDVKKFAKHYKKLLSEPGLDPIRHGVGKQKYEGGAYFNSEYGGIKWDENPDGNSWGYGNAPKTKEEFIERYKGLTNVLLDNGKMLGFCYTQLYDVEQEKNGLMTFDRKYKFAPEIIKAINTRKAKIED